MRVRHTFRHVESSDGLKNYTEEKLGKLGKYLLDASEADVTYSMHKHVHQVEVIVRSNGERYAGKVESENMYASVDMVVHKLERQVRDRKDHGARERRQGKSVRDGVELMPDPAEEPGG